ncbi:dissimilatory-type sulfite reductase subunit alpha [sulfur-oxidizing endosymbiont of Gigantopelta aegis]|uniref:dissimilatory-type sulfite reductase subunit alpha n=1 Tax=sulfur-oxidizing endosymbiont of Gigantopelta aegis TaxID=2794934 RepID=UPI0018DBAB98|nr:dissimilatory-type sulfite reductase subunit alpha [sulfur-oxidizing endosymbiont of Gigantopelta aegis]
MSKVTIYDTPMLDELENGEWPSFITAFKRLRDDHPSERINSMVGGLLGQLEHSYETRMGWWKGGTVSVFGYGGGIIPRFSEVAEHFPESKEFHTVRVQPPAGNFYTADILNQLADDWEAHGSGLQTFHGQTGNIMFIGATTDEMQPFFDKVNSYGWDLGGAGPCVRTAMACVGAARCEHSCTNEHGMMRHLVNEFQDDLHRPALPYKFKVKVSGCPNDCTNAIERADMAVIGIWRDEMKVDQTEVKAFVADKGRDYVIDNVTDRCPTNAIKLADDDTLVVNNKECVRCMHCINVMTKALAPGDDKGVTILIGGKRTLKIGDMMGTVVAPFLKVDTMEEIEYLVELTGEMIDFFAENALEHERTGEMIERIGLVNYLEGIGLDLDPNMVSEPRQCSYVRMDGWDEEVKKWYDKKAEAATA